MFVQITPKQEDVLRELPDTQKNIAEALGITRRAVKYWVNKLNECGLNFVRDNDGGWVGFLERVQLSGKT